MVVNVFRKKDLPMKIVLWLNRHDCESGDLYGVLQKAKGTPVAKTSHINRSRRGLVIRGRDAGRFLLLFKLGGADTEQEAPHLGEDDGLKDERCSDKSIADLQWTFC